MMYAYLNVSPNTKWGRNEKPRVYEPRKDDEGPRWREEDWSIGTEMFTGKKNLHHNKAGVYIPYGSHTVAYDARIVPSEAESHLKDINARILALHREYQAYVDEHFREWPVMTESDCMKTVRAKYASEREAKADMGPQPKLTAKQKREAQEKARRFAEALS